MVDMARLQAWLDRYVEAWRSNDPDRIGALFSTDASYAYTPFQAKPVRGRDAVVRSWLKKPDDPHSWECRYEAVAVTGEVGVARGWTRYRAAGKKPEREYHNIFVMRFDADDRCREFTEWYMKVTQT